MAVRCKEEWISKNSASTRKWIFECMCRFIDYLTETELWCDTFKWSSVGCSALLANH